MQYGFSLRSIHEKYFHELVAILDLKVACDSLPRDRILARQKPKVPQLLFAALANMLAQNWIWTLGDPPKHYHRLEKGVPQGEVLSPILYKTDMDSFYEAVADVPAAIQTRTAIMYADDVRMQSRSPQGLQIFLKRGHRWARENTMTWSPAKSFVLYNKHAKRHYFFLGHDRLTKPPISSTWG